MGWNSWDSYGTTVREDQVKANADAMAGKLKKFGWQYITVDIQWYEPNAQGHDYKPGAPLVMDAYGRLTPAPNRFPSAAGDAGFKPLADYVHAKGLKFGIHILRGIPRQAVDKNLPIFGTKFHAADIADKTAICDWNPDMYGVDMTRPGAQAYYDSIAKLYASWGVDFVKADDMRPYEKRLPEVAAISAALKKTGRPIVLSLSPGEAPIPLAADFEKYAQMWRVSDDFWDDWKLLRKEFDYARGWQPYIGTNNTWPDADMLPLGKLRITDASGPADSKFTPDEQQTLITLWSMIRSPLIFGGDLPTLDAATLALITNPSVIAIDQHSRNNHQVIDRDDLRVWTADPPSRNGKYVAVFNITDQPQSVDLAWSDVKIAYHQATLLNLWTRQPVHNASRLQANLPAHGSALYLVTGSNSGPSTAK
jgi:hypothetical protein